MAHLLYSFFDNLNITDMCHIIKKTKKAIFSLFNKQMRRSDEFLFLSDFQKLSVNKI